MGKLSFTYLKISLDCLEFISSFSSKATKQLRHSPDPRYNGTYTNSRESCQLQQSLRSQLHSRPPCITSSEEVCCGYVCQAFTCFLILSSALFDTAVQY